MGETREEGGNFNSRFTRYTIVEKELNTLRNGEVLIQISTTKTSFCTIKIQVSIIKKNI